VTTVTKGALLLPVSPTPPLPGDLLLLSHTPSLVAAEALAWLQRTGREEDES